MSRLENPAGSGYAPGYDIGAWKAGRDGEENVAALLNGTLEVKADLRARDRIFVEYACDWEDGNGWRPSGIAISNADAWVIMLPGSYLVVQTERLKRLCRGIKATGQRARADPPDDWGLVEKPRTGPDEPPTRGVVIPFRHVLGLLASV